MLLLVLVTSVLLTWVLQLLLALRVVRTVPSVSALDAPTLEAWPLLTIVVPARDEARHVEEALRSKLSCGYPNLEVVAVDDRSTDGTGEVMRRLADSDARLRVCRVDELPEGWLGKLHAMQRGFSSAKGEWVLFSDADVHLEPRMLEQIVAHAEAERLDFVAVFPRMEPVGIAVDACMAGLLRFLSLMGRIWRANDDRAHVGMGVGAFNLARRSWLERTQAIAHLRMEVADDVALGALLKQSGARCRFYAGREAAHLVFQDSLRAVAKSAYKGGGMLGFVLWKPVLFALVPVTWELLLPCTGILSGGPSRWLGAAALLFATATHGVLARHFGVALKGALFWPVGQVVTAALTLGAGLQAWRDQGIHWRDTFYSRQVLEAGRRFGAGDLRVHLLSDEGPTLLE